MTMLGVRKDFLHREDIGISGGSYWAGRALARPLFGPLRAK